MLGTFSAVKGFIPVGKKAGKCELESPVAKLNYRATTLLLLGCCLLVTSIEWIGNDSKIACVMGKEQTGSDDTWTVPKDMINTYCYISTTFTIPNQGAGRPGVNVYDKKGLGPFRRGKDEVKHAAYYQWVPFMLFLQAALFYAPHQLLKSWEGGKIEAMLSGLNSFILEKAERIPRERALAEYFVQNINTHNVWAAKMFLCEVISFCNVLFNIVFIDIFLGGEFSTFGIEVIKMLDFDAENRIDPMSRVFPTVTKCTYYKFGGSGTIQNLDSICVLPINIINEKIYVFLWFWLTILSVVTGLAMLYHLFLLLAAPVRNMLLRSQAAHQNKVTHTFDNITPYLQVGDWKVLYLLGSNMEPLVFGEVVVEIGEVMKLGKYGPPETTRL